ncbi:imidazole glycerol phosphate synthase subunit HisH [Hyphobacterium sp. HN65]|uniref:Imidazole glycerol phosphate synthase subunit HisH n=1 Tax=Hyphobacterium lacteum TaxID=3116575 RepID=A0ABU7LSE8_9PROT|nr:imidazole glycerol phosphate synthase subunit HisH [Hyphobacterium sp. HN65]MEE2526822.1 imidazole glycerol phosphate synthase subunit HisH [Hyphobacterium sp. HN65]
MRLAIINTGSANRFSVETALKRIGADCCDAKTPEDADGADALVLPGVGSAAPAMKVLEASGWRSRLQSETRPVFGICLGMQLLFERSAEGDVETLGVIRGEVRRLPESGLSWPHMGWNALQITRPDPLLERLSGGDYMYFANGYYVPECEATLATVSYGETISAIVRQGNFMGCQFHPERSAKAGQQVLRNFCELAS